VKTLVSELFRRQRKMTLWCMFILSVLAVGMVLPQVAAGPDGSRSLLSPPAAVQNLLGPLSLLLFSLAAAIYAVIFSSSTISREAQRGTIEFVLSQPLARTSFIWSRLVVGAAYLAAMVAGSWAAAAAVMIGFEIAVPWAGSGMAAAGLYLIALPFLTWSMACSSFLDDERRARNYMTAGVVLLYSSLAAVAATKWTRGTGWLPVYNLGNLLALVGELRGVVLASVAVCSLMAAAAGLTLALYRYDRRDIVG